MDIKYYETRHIYMALAICLALSSPVLLIVLPQLIASTVYHVDGLWHVFVPRENYYLYGLSLIFLLIGLMVLFLWDIHKKSILFSVISVIFSFGFLYVGALSYQSLSEEGISYRTLYPFSNHQYQWHEIDKVYYLLAEDDGFSQYKIVFKDGSQLTLINNEYFHDIKKAFYARLKEIGVQIERK